MRARSIKPGICDNEILGTADPFYTLLFERLWMMADREGRLEDRPLRIKAQAFPYREGIDVDAMLTWLHDHQFIQRYSIGGQSFIQVVKFKDHQKPHQNEKDSVIPAPPESSVAQASTTKVESEHNQGSKHFALNPSSLTPDSGLLTADTSARVSHEGIEGIKRAYPKRSGREDWIIAERCCLRLVDAGESWEILRNAAARYASYCAAVNTDPSRVMKPSTFFSADDCPWRQEWQPPPSKAQRQQDANVDVGLEWLRGANGARA